MYSLTPPPPQELHDAATSLPPQAVVTLWIGIPTVFLGLLGFLWNLRTHRRNSRREKLNELARHLTDTLLLVLDLAQGPVTHDSLKPLLRRRDLIEAVAARNDTLRSPLTTVVGRIDAYSGTATPPGDEVFAKVMRAAKKSAASGERELDEWLAQAIRQGRAAGRLTEAVMAAQSAVGDLQGN
ncbi:hypothetical protein CUT44_12110 [Streptomyces carminius]|uniref:Uncharacterized protein n=1 Tax=Streptomyces carminius TaxID=2665496 RepID=A0A2M8LZP7_9ACTN|nr:hypothetical protein [Streptomyces carminius]PJE97424.1 hypothetical protein CUT44_12110 [Streptomyces carminius]